MDQQNFNMLLERFLNGTASESEKILLDEYFERLRTMEAEEGNIVMNEQQLKQEMLNNILNRIKPVEEKPAVIRRFPQWRKFAAAAAAIVLLFMGYRMFLTDKTPEKLPVITEVKQSTESLIPGTNKAVLTLSGGQRVVLDSTGSSSIEDEGMKMLRSDNHLSYQPNSGDQAVNAYNTLSTPRGGQYQLTLSDGTRVWMNAASSIRYPVAFNGTERTVELNGEAYFEVAKNATKPFFVKTSDMRVEVLGTHFNVMAYEDEPVVATTLLEGSVRLQTSAGEGLLKPGQQGKLSTEAKDLKIGSCDMEKVMAWKEGLFRFKGDDIRSIMRQLSRWYDVDVVYTGNVSNKRYSGSISKYVNASEVFSILNLAGIVFKQEGKIITVSQTQN